MDNVIFQKVINCGIVEYNNIPRKVSIKLELRQVEDNKIEFSSVGNIGHVLGGQCIDEIAKLFPNDKKIQRIAEISKRFHLNTFHAGCVHQREFEKEPYEKHAGCHCEICNYTYGHGWQYEPIPEEILTEIKNM